MDFHLKPRYYNDYSVSEQKKPPYFMTQGTGIRNDELTLTRCQIIIVRLAGRQNMNTRNTQLVYTLLAIAIAANTLVVGIPTAFETAAEQHFSDGFSAAEISPFFNEFSNSKTRTCTLSHIAAFQKIPARGSFGLPYETSLLSPQFSACRNDTTDGRSHFLLTCVLLI